MEAVGAYEAKTHLAQILDRVAEGERFTISRHGVPVAILQPAAPAKQISVRSAIEQIRNFRKGRRLAGLSLRDLIEAGRD